MAGVLFFLVTEELPNVHSCDWAKTEVETNRDRANNVFFIKSPLIFCKNHNELSKTRTYAQSHLMLLKCMTSRQLQLMLCEF